MSEKKETLVSKIGQIATLKEIVTGLIIIVSLIGALYGSLKPETQAEENKTILAPIVEENEENGELLKIQEERLMQYEHQLIVLQEKFEIIELINISLLQQQDDHVIRLDDVYKLFKSRHRHEKNDPKPDIEINIKPRAKTYWK